MFDSTIQRGDPESTLRIAVAASGLTGTVVSGAAWYGLYYMAVVVGFLILYAIYLVFGGPAPTLPALMVPPPPPVEIVELTMDDLDEELLPMAESVGGELPEPADIIGQAPDPDAYVEPEVVESKVALDRAIAERAGIMAIIGTRDDSMEIGLLGTLGDGGELDSIFSGSALSSDLDGGLGGLIGAKGVSIGSGGIGSRGSGMGGGGTGEGLGGLGTKGGGTGSIGYGRGGGGTGISGIGSSLVQVSGTSTHASEGGSVCRFTLADSKVVRSSGCDGKLLKDAQAAVRSQGKLRRDGSYRVRLTRP